jgi:NADH:ubiquinone oxidoreductase subunit E
MNKSETKAYKNILKHAGDANKENLFMLLGQVQDALGYVPTDVICDIATRTGVSQARIYGALTSYGDFVVEQETEESK